MKKFNLQNLLKDRKTLYLVLTIVIILVFTLSIAYASLSTILEISGNAQILSAEWDIHLDDVSVKSGSVSANAPQISGNSSVSFDVDLNTPGDFYEFTVDVVNLGSIDAMIDSVVKTPELTSEQAKYIKYEVTYENGDSISTKQVLESSTSTPIKVRIEYRKDILASDLPSSTTELSLKLTLVYVQSDGTGSSSGSGGSSSVVSVVSGDGTQVGNEVCISEECFYVMYSDEETVTMLSKYNLYVGNSVDEEDNITPLENPTGIQKSSAIGYEPGNWPSIGTTVYSYNDNSYSGSVIKNYIDNYSNYLISKGVMIIESRLITIDELNSLGCDYMFMCGEAPEWVYSTSYWTGSSVGEQNYGVDRYSSISLYNYDFVYLLGVRPVITIDKSEFKRLEF